MTLAAVSGQARVIARFNKNFIIETPDGNVLAAVARKKCAAAVCGDRIEWQSTDNNSAVITAITARQSLLSRPDRRGKLKPVAANIDQIIIVCAPLPDDSRAIAPRFSLDLLDQYLVAAEELAVQPVIVANKADQLDTAGQEAAQQQFAYYQQLGYPFIMTSTKDNTGMAALAHQLHDKTSIFVGESGVGKSSLIHTLLPDQDIRIGRISELSGLGRHTTTTTMLYHLLHGGHLIDSPGVREFTLGHIDLEALQHGFREIAGLHGQCRFRDCRHIGEAGCRVQQAADAGQISARRLNTYRQLHARLEND